MSKFTHIDAKGEARMVDVSDKPVQQRTAVARGEIHMAKETLKLIRGDKIAKGNVLATARIAGIQAAKRTGDRHDAGRVRYPGLDHRRHARVVEPPPPRDVVVPVVRAAGVGSRIACRPESLITARDVRPTCRRRRARRSSCSGWSLSRGR